MAGPSGEAGRKMIQEKLEKAQELKAQGNDHFKQQEIKKAIKSYHSALMYVKGIDQDLNPNQLVNRGQETPALSPEVREDITNISATLHNNLAACLLKQEPVRYERVVSCCTQVTEKQPHNIKGWYRLGLAYYHLRDFDRAKDSLTQANKESGGQDQAVRRLMVAVDQELKKEKKKFSDMFKNSLLAKET